MAINYKSYEFQCYEYIRRMENLLNKGDVDSELAQLGNEAERLRRNLEGRRFRVAIVGEFNRGKTSFVNALLGQEILPADSMPATAAINRITYGDTPRAYLSMKDGSCRPVEIAQLADYVTKYTSAAAENAAQISEAVVEYPSLFCRNGADLIDTPGMNDEEDMNRTTVSQLKDIDLAIVAVDASLPFSMTECAFTAQLLESPQVCQIVVVITKIDCVREREREKLIGFLTSRVREMVLERLETSCEPDSPILQKYHDIFDALYVFAVSSTDALDALACNDMALFQSSGFLRLNDELPKIIMASQNSNVVLNSERLLEDIIRRYRKYLTARCEHCREQLPRLDELKRRFPELCRQALIGVLTISESAVDLPDAQGEAAAVRRQFTQALGRMRALDYAALQTALSPVVKRQFRSLNERFSTQEQAWLDDYQQRALEPARRTLCRQLGVLLAPFPSLKGEALKGAEALPLTLDRSKSQTEAFYWILSPIPAPGRVETDWQVMPTVDLAIKQSLQDYQIRRRKQIERLFAHAKGTLESAIDEITEQFGHKADQLAQRLCECQGERDILKELDRLEEECRSMREQFQLELRGNERRMAQAVDSPIKS